MSKIDPFRELLGQVPDAKIAELSGLKESTVARYRQEADIPAFDADEDVGDIDPDAASDIAPGEVADPEALAAAKAAGVITEVVDLSADLPQRLFELTQETDLEALQAVCEDTDNEVVRAVAAGRITALRAAKAAEARARGEDTLVIRVKERTTIAGVGYKGKPVRVPVSRSLYRGEMARKLLTSIEDKSIVEIVSE